MASSSESAWIPCQGINATVLRHLRSRLIKGDYYAISDGENIARVKGHGDVAYVTTKQGARIDVVPDPIVLENAWTREIADTKAVWCLREADYLPSLPAVRWFKKVSVDEDWFVLELPGSEASFPAAATANDVPTASQAAEIVLPTDVPVTVDSVDSISFGGSLLISCQTMATMMSSTIALVLFSKHRWWAVPMILSTGTGTVVWQLGSEDNWANLTSASSSLIDGVSNLWTSFLTGMFWIIFCLCAGACCWIAFRVWRWTNNCLRWLEPSIVDSEVDSQGSSAGLQTPTHQRLLSPEQDLPLPADATITQIFDSPGELASISPTSIIDSHVDDGAGVFSSSASRRRFEQALPSAPQPITVCCAHTVFPADGVGRPLASFPCMADTCKHVILLGDEVIVQDGIPLRTPATGSTVALCDDHTVAYERRSRSYRCSIRDCHRRGFPVSVHNHECLTCALHLPEQLEGLTDSQHLDAPAATAEPDQPNKKSVTVVDDREERDSARLPTNPFPGEKEGQAFEQTIDSSAFSTSESWSERENELKRIVNKRARKEAASKPPKQRRRSNDGVGESNKPARRRSLEDCVPEEPKKSRRKKKSVSDSDTSIESRVTIFRKSLSVRRSDRSSQSSNNDRRQSRVSRVSRDGRSTKRRERDLDRNNSLSSEGSSVAPTVRSGESFVRLPSFLKQPLPRGTDAPVILKDDPKLHKRKKSGWESVADALASRDGAKEGDSETTYPRLLERTLFALRGFGRFDIAWGIGSYGETSRI